MKRNLSSKSFIPPVLLRLFLVLTAFVISVMVTGATAATNLGLYVHGQNPFLIANYGNPTQHPDLRPPPEAMDLGPVGTYFHGTRTVSIVETNQSHYTGSTPRWGGPGDSWSSYSLTSPTPGSTRQTPIVVRFDSRITNANSAVGYWTETGLGSYWYFDQPTTNIHFRVDWSITYVGEPFIEQRCVFVPPFQFVCNDVSITSTGAFQAGMWIDGFGERSLSPPPGGSAVVTSGTQTGSFGGIAKAPHLLINFNTRFYEGQSTRGDGRLIMEARIFADTIPLIDPRLRLTRLPDNWLEIGWPASATGYVLQTTVNVTLANWNAVAEAPVIVGEENIVTLTLGGLGHYFRLFKQ